MMTQSVSIHYDTTLQLWVIERHRLTEPPIAFFEMDINTAGATFTRWLELIGSPIAADFSEAAQ